MVQRAVQAAINMRHNESTECTLFELMSRTVLVATQAFFCIEDVWR